MRTAPPLGLLLLAWLCSGGFAGPVGAAVAWRDLLRQPAGWYAGADARALAATLVSYQAESGGWPKNTDMTQPPPAGWSAEATIDNGATTLQLNYLARVVTGSGDAPSRAAAERGLDYLFAAQYPNGGWPQFFPLRKGYYSHITFNDDAMVNVLTVLHTVALGEPPYAWVDPARRARAASAVARGVDCILRCQIVVDGVKTAWCAQHDETTFAPAKARKYEHPSLSGMESTGILRFLMRLDRPSPEVVVAVRAGVAWLEQVKLTGMRVEAATNPALPHGADKHVVSDPSAPPLWARFYEIGTNRPMFGGRDSVIHYTLAEVEPERRAGYTWYSETPQKLLTKEYPRWAKKWLPAAP